MVLVMFRNLDELDGNLCVHISGLCKAGVHIS